MKTESQKLYITKGMIKNVKTELLLLFKIVIKDEPETKTTSLH